MDAQRVAKHFKIKNMKHDVEDGYFMDLSDTEMKILYEQSSFYLLQDGKKIKIDNQNEAEDACWRSDNRINDHISLYNWKRLVLKEGDSFDLPKELSVEVRLVTTGRSMESNRTKKIEEVAILSKSSSPEIPDSSEKIIDQIKKIIEGVSDDTIERYGRLINESEAFYAIKELIEKSSPPTVAGTSTEVKSDSGKTEQLRKAGF